MLNAQMIDDPFWRDNENEILKLMENDYLYSRSFIIDTELLNYDKVFLVCEGLDTIAEVTINGKPAGYADNMHRTWEYSIKSMLIDGANSIDILLKSPTSYIKEQQKLILQTVHQMLWLVSH